MSWLDDTTCDYRYACQACKEDFLVRGLASEGDKAREDHFCECGGRGVYVGFLPQKMGGMVKVEFEKNGRKAYEFRRPDGKVGYMSKTKYDYLETGRIVPQYTTGYADHLKASGREDLLEEQRPSGRRAKATTIPKGGDTAHEV